MKQRKNRFSNDSPWTCVYGISTRRKSLAGSKYPKVPPFRCPLMHSFVHQSVNPFVSQFDFTLCFGFCTATKRDTVSSRSGSSHLDRSTLSAALNLTGWPPSKNLLSGSLDDTTGDGEAGRFLEPEINFASSLTSFVDTPVMPLDKYP